MDCAAYTLVTIQYNLMAETAPNAFVQSLLFYGQYPLKIVLHTALTEVAHGLDARNLETATTLLRNRQFDLHTPHPGAAKIMPPTMPKKGHGCIALMMARLIVKEEDHGIRPFVVSVLSRNM
ncbi:hypothetical protein BT96DRAFT_660665 [Gymnopus androsaceus JB14]|uniref:Uncharacterized protein n=1 Tax=Gymnopus androsaceus JB14 TaxID=1447944 RepID=A0A6A4HPP4_9AGAR|nr:hypothetical protein BT96DRAFT_660665 [Gymnopus androsaceus JB14]